MNIKKTVINKLPVPIGSTILFITIVSSSSFAGHKTNIFSTSNQIKLEQNFLINDDFNIEQSKKKDKGNGVMIAQQNSLWDKFLEGLFEELGRTATRETWKLIQQGYNNRANSSTSITEREAENIIRFYLEAKKFIFASPYDIGLLRKITAGEKLEKSIGSVNWLKNNNARYTYPTQKINYTKFFSSDKRSAIIEVNITERRKYYVNGKLKSNKSDTDSYIYTIRNVGNSWKILHSRTVK